MEKLQEIHVASVWAAQGYVEMAPQINGDWGGKRYIDLMKGVDHACTLPHEAMQLFTTPQRKGIPSEFLYFPDERHWSPSR